MSVYLVLELVIIELLGIDAERAMDPEYGVHLLSILG
jgi:predicted DNA-binding protein with PD1-like motif